VTAPGLDRLCEECDLPGLEPSYHNTRRLHIACAAFRMSRAHRKRTPAQRVAENVATNAARAQARAERYESDPEYRARVDVIAQFSLSGRPPLERTVLRVLWSRYRLREPDFYRLLAWQDDHCPCGKPFGPLRGDRAMVPHVDHDHRCCPGSATVKTCGQCVRGLLHGPCNRLVGMIENNPDVCEPRGWVAKYLSEPPYPQMLHMDGN